MKCEMKVLIKIEQNKNKNENIKQKCVINKNKECVRKRTLISLSLREIYRLT